MALTMMKKLLPKFKYMGYRHFEYDCRACGKRWNEVSNRNSIPFDEIYCGPCFPKVYKKEDGGGTDDRG